MIQSGAGNNFVQSAQLARASRASRAGTRAARIIRIIRLLRLVRIFKLYKIARSKIKNKEAVLLRSEVTCRDGIEIEPINLLRERPENIEVIEDSISQEFDSFGDNFEYNLDLNNGLGYDRRFSSMKRTITLGESKPDLPEESKVGKKLSELTTVRVITLILIMIIVLPFFNLYMYTQIDAYTLGLELINNFIEEPTKAEFYFEAYYTKYMNGTSPLIYLVVANTNYT